MNTSQIFTGTIRRCTEHEVHSIFSLSTYIDGQCIGCDGIGSVHIDSEIYKENAVLIKLQNGDYVDLESLDSILDYIRIYQSYSYGLRGLMMSSFQPNHVGELFVDDTSLKPYYGDEQASKHVSVYQLKKRVEASK